MFRAKIPHFTSKIVEHSRHLPSLNQMQARRRLQVFLMGKSDGPLSFLGVEQVTGSVSTNKRREGASLLFSRRWVSG